jgi:hypothetical protein
MFNGPVKVDAASLISLSASAEGKHIVTFSSNQAFNYIIKVLSIRHVSFNLTGVIRELEVETRFLPTIQEAVKYVSSGPVKPYALPEFTGYDRLSSILFLGELCKFEGKAGIYLVFEDIDSFNLAIRGLVEYDCFCIAFRVADNPLTVEIKDIVLLIRCGLLASAPQESSSAEAAASVACSPPRPRF